MGAQVGLRHDQLNAGNGYLASTIGSNLPYALFLASAAILAATAFGSAWAEEYKVVIPQRASDPAFDPQLARPDDFYSPPKLIIRVNDTVTWVINDTEKHTVTSGQSSGRVGFIQGNMGEPDGIFDSGLFDIGKEWSYTFAVPGVFPDFCTLPPWMFGGGGG